MAGADVSWLLEQCAAFVADPEGHRQRCRADDSAYLARMADGVQAISAIAADHEALTAENEGLRVVLDLISGALATTPKPADHCVVRS